MGTRKRRGEIAKSESESESEKSNPTEKSPTDPIPSNPVSSLMYKISKTICMSRVEFMTLETFAMIHTRLDAISSKISKSGLFGETSRYLSASCWIRRIAGLPRVSETRQTANSKERWDPLSHPGGQVALSFLLHLQPQSRRKKQTPKWQAFSIGE